MLTCEAMPDCANPAYISYYFTTKEGFAKVYAASPGTAARNRTLTADSLMAITVPVPSIKVQRQFVALQSELAHLSKVQLEEISLSEAVVPALISRVLV
jgi:restriction endonuclease S subunit